MRWLKKLWDRYRDGANNNSFTWRGEAVRPFPTRWREVKALESEREAAIQRLKDLIHMQHTMDKPPSRLA